MPCDSGTGCGAVAPPSLETEAGARAIVAGSAGAVDAWKSLTRNPADMRKIAAESNRPIVFSRRLTNLPSRPGIGITPPLSSLQRNLTVAINGIVL